MSEIKPFTGVDDRVALADVVPIDTPFTIGISASSACNFKCNYCVQSIDNETLKSKYDFKRIKMDFDLFTRIVNQCFFFPKKIKLLTFMGQGEPLLNPELSNMIAYAKKSENFERIDVVTNGSLLNYETSDRLINSGLDALRISLQGMTPEKYKSISNVNLNFDDLIDNIKYFYDKSRGKCKVYVKIMNVSLDKNEENLFYETFDKITDRMFIEQLKPVYDGVDYNEYDYTLSSDRRGNIHEKRYVCPQPFFTLSIWPDGEVIPCSAIHKVCSLGNIKNSPLITMWNSKKLKNFQIMQLKKLRFDHPQCKLCCAPDDCSHIEDVLDNKSEDILKKVL